MNGNNELCFVPLGDRFSSSSTNALKRPRSSSRDHSDDICTQLHISNYYTDYDLKCANDVYCVYIFVIEQMATAAADSRQRDAAPNAPAATPRAQAVSTGQQTIIRMAGTSELWKTIAGVPRLL